MTTVEVVVSTNKKKTAIDPQPDGSLKISLRSPARENLANLELIALLSEYYQISKSSIKIKRGFKSKHKLVQMDNGD